MDLRKSSPVGRGGTGAALTSSSWSRSASTGAVLLRRRAVIRRDCNIRVAEERRGVRCRRNGTTAAFTCLFPADDRSSILAERGLRRSSGVPTAAGGLSGRGPQTLGQTTRPSAERWTANLAFASGLPSSDLLQSVQLKVSWAARRSDRHRAWVGRSFLWCRPQFGRRASRAPQPGGSGRHKERAESDRVACKRAGRSEFGKGFRRWRPIGRRPRRAQHGRGGGCGSTMVVSALLHSEIAVLRMRTTTDLGAWTICGSRTRPSCRASPVANQCVGDPDPASLCTLRGLSRVARLMRRAGPAMSLVTDRQRP